jgi:hypothetical protein
VRREVRTFATTAAELLALQEWLVAAGCTHAVLESTGAVRLVAPGATYTAFLTSTETVLALGGDRRGAGDDHRHGVNVDHH